jgi:DNA-directed RNA polymerase specialized sigma24 family protein
VGGDVLDGGAALEALPVAPPVATFDDVYRREYAPLCRLAFVLTGDTGAAEELVQEAFLAAHRRWAEVGELQRPGAWVRLVVVRRAVSWRRRVGAEVRARVRLGHREAVEFDPVTIDVAAAVRALPRRQAQVAALCLLDGWTVVDAAAGHAGAPGHPDRYLPGHRAADLAPERPDPDDRCAPRLLRHRVPRLTSRAASYTGVNTV